jgi:hypothetical protein
MMPDKLDMSGMDRFKATLCECTRLVISHGGVKWNVSLYTCRP